MAEQAVGLGVGLELDWKALSEEVSTKEENGKQLTAKLEQVQVALAESEAVVRRLEDESKALTVAVNEKDDAAKQLAGELEQVHYLVHCLRLPLPA